MRILGLTGGIAMGKSTAARALRRLGVPVHDADATVHRLYGPGGRGVPVIAEHFPEAVARGAVDRAALSRLLVGAPERFALLDRLMHPLVRQETLDWLARRARQRRPLVALDIPLLYEGGGGSLCDAVITVSAPPFLQRQRALARPGMTPEKLATILRRQVPDAVRRRRADHVVPTGLGKAFAFRRLEAAVAEERGKPGRAWSLRRPRAVRRRG